MKRFPMKLLMIGTQSEKILSINKIRLRLKENLENTIMTCILNTDAKTNIKLLVLHSISHTRLLTQKNTSTKQLLKN